MNIRLPLLVSFLVSTAGLAWGSKSVHIKSGLLFAGLSVVHTYQHRRNILLDLKKGCDKIKMLDFLKIPLNKEDFLLSQVQVAHYIPGRIRLTSRKLVQNQALAQKIEAALREIRELKSYKLNLITGSILLEYTPEAVACNPRLARIERAVMKKYKKV